MNTEKVTAAICGLWCRSCIAYIGTHEEPLRLELLAKSTGQPVEKLKCNGCRSGRLTWYCETCAIAACAREKGLEFCGNCTEFPCSRITSFHGSLPHRAEVIPSLCMIRDEGWESWYDQMNALYSCSACATINSAYDLKCRNCGQEPANEYVRRHEQQILTHFAARKGN